MGHKNLLFVGLALAAFGAVGCGPDIAGICEQQEACIGGNEADIDACIASAEGQRDAAVDIGCGSEFDVFVECNASLLECSSQSTGQQCASSSDCGGPAVCSAGQCTVKAYGVPDADRDKCEVEGSAYSRCF
jgi:hypothetical protein